MPLDEGKWNWNSGRFIAGAEWTAQIAASLAESSLTTFVQVFLTRDARPLE